MPNFVAGTFNIGTDKSIVIIDNDTGAPIDLGGHVIDFTSQPKHKTITSDPIDAQGYSQHRLTYDGWSGTVTVYRANGGAEALEALMEANYHNGGTQKYFTITETIRNQYDGSVNIFQYIYAVMMLQDAGTWKKDAAVPIRVQFEAQGRTQLQ